MNVSKVEDKLRKIEGIIDNLYEELDTGHFFEDGITEELFGDTPLPKKKKERLEFLENAARKKFPKLVSEIESLDVAMQGVGVFIDRVKDNLDRKREVLEEIDQLQEEIEDKKRELDLRQSVIEKQLDKISKKVTETQEKVMKKVKGAKK